MPSLEDLLKALADNTRVKRVAPNTNNRSIGPAAPLGTNSVIPDKLKDQFLTGTGRFDPETLTGILAQLSGTAFAAQSGARANRDLREGHPGRAAFGAAASTLPIDEIPGVGALAKKVAGGLEHLAGGATAHAAEDWAAKHAAAPRAEFPPQTDIPRLVKPRVDPNRIADVESEALKTYTGPEFTKWLKDGNHADWYDTRQTEQRAVDALGEEEGPQAFSRLMEIIGATTARSDPGNNLRRASYYKGLDNAGLLDTDALRAGAYKKVPVGMGHLANNAHHAGLAGLLEKGEIDPLVNPKPAGFVANLKRNMQPFTNDTRMATGAALANPKLLDIGAIIKSVGKDGGVTYSPRDWAYAPMERAAQAAAKIHAGNGLVSVPDGVAPTANFQAGVWDGLSSIIKGASPSQGRFHEVFSKKLEENAKKWGLSNTEANALFWQGHPLDLSLKQDLIPRGLLR